MNVNHNFGFYAILTNPARGYEYLTRLLVDHEVPFVQLRMKDAADDEIVRQAETMRHLTQGTSTRLIVNDSPRLAALVGADGVHLGQSDMPFAQAREIVGDDAIVGLSTHNPQQTADACALQPDYIGIGPVYATPTKKLPDPVLGLDTMHEMVLRATVPAVCIGGIDLANLHDVLAAGARNVCMVRQLCAAADPEGVLKKALQIIADYGREQS
ncbi:MAG: thiamine phosphate synthase [Chitinivibrionales bacterium]|nr:thiamine phosphate synthase [Chitinivibrionales bacterium]